MSVAVQNSQNEGGNRRDDGNVDAYQDQKRRERQAPGDDNGLWVYRYGIPFAATTTLARASRRGGKRQPSGKQRAAGRQSGHRDGRQGGMRDRRDHLKPKAINLHGGGQESCEAAHAMSRPFNNPSASPSNVTGPKIGTRMWLEISISGFSPPGHGVH